MKNFFKLLLISFFTLTSIPLSYSQKRIKVKEAIGLQIVENNITPQEAENMALRNAKQEAMRKAGIPEKVWSVLGQITDSKNDELIEAYSEMSTITLNGLVTVLDKTVENLWDAEREQLSKRVTISANVLEETATDDEFAIAPQGFKKVYQEGESLDFDVKIYNRDAYIKVFWFDSKEGALVFPLSSNEDQKFKANSSPHFPQGDIVFKLSKTDSKAHQEEVNVMIVATKSNIPFIGDVNFESVIKWIYNIPADKRVSNCTRFVIM